MFKCPVTGAFLPEARGQSPGPRAPRGPGPRPEPMPEPMPRAQGPVQSSELGAKGEGGGEGGNLWGNVWIPAEGPRPGHRARGQKGGEWERRSGGGRVGSRPPGPLPPELGGVTPGPRRSDQEEEWGGEGIGEGLVPPDFRAQGSKICEERALGEGLGEGMLGKGAGGRWGVTGMGERMQLRVRSWFRAAVRSSIQKCRFQH